MQHKDNPVDWYPWGHEAFERARREDKPVFLSIGYATCHWCHVMEHESFEDPEAAKLLNDAFVCIKVDREERPDIDQTYMRVCQMLTGAGGWPLTILLTPDAKPFFAGTYIPKTERFGRPGLVDLVPRVKELWKKDRQRLVDSADDITSHLQDSPPKKGGARIDLGVVEAAAAHLASIYDPVHGGFGGPPKFPTPHQLVFLLRYADRTGDEEAAHQVYHTLRQMRRGGIFDQVGFGFHRYATDREWFLPHFEKMLYDQALLVKAYVEAFQRSGDAEFEKTAREIIEYVLRDLGATEGGFHSAEDADSEGVEGKFYAWTWQDLEATVPRGDLRWLAPLFGLVPDGNLHDEAHGNATGMNHFHLAETWQGAAQTAGTTPEALQAKWETIRRTLLRVRSRRVRPLKDDKVLTDWNGLMIGALARAARAFQEPAFAKAATRAAEFVAKNLRDPQGRLLHRFRDGDASILGFLDDHAFLADGLTDLYEATGDPRHLRAALELADAMTQRFWNETRGGFDFTSKDHEALISRAQDWYDGAIPSGNSVALLCFVRLGRMTGRTDLESIGQRLLDAAAPHVARGPGGHAQLLLGLDFAFGPTRELVLAGATEAAVRALRHVADTTYSPRTVLLVKVPERQKALAELAPFTKDLSAGTEAAVAFLCQDYRCDLPVVQPASLKAALKASAEEQEQPRSGGSSGGAR